MDGAGFAFRGDHSFASIRMQANTDYSTSPAADRKPPGIFNPGMGGFGGLGGGATASYRIHAWFTTYAILLTRDAVFPNMPCNECL
jgi:hypothetical protein